MELEKTRVNLDLIKMKVDWTSPRTFSTQTEMDHAREGLRCRVQDFEFKLVSPLSLLDFSTTNFASPGLDFRPSQVQSVSPEMVSDGPSEQVLPENLLEEIFST